MTKSVVGCTHSFIQHIFKAPFCPQQSLLGKVRNVALLIFAVMFVARMIIRQRSFQWQLRDDPRVDEVAKQKFISDIQNAMMGCPFFKGFKGHYEDELKKIFGSFSVAQLQDKRIVEKLEGVLSQPMNPNVLALANISVSLENEFLNCAKSFRESKDNAEKEPLGELARKAATKLMKFSYFVSMLMLHSPSLFAQKEMVNGQACPEESDTAYWRGVRGCVLVYKLLETYYKISNPLYPLYEDPNLLYERQNVLPHQWWACFRCHAYYYAKTKEKEWNLPESNELSKHLAELRLPPPQCVIL